MKEELLLIKDVKLSEQMSLATGQDGKELLRVRIRIEDRNGGEPRSLLIRFPVLAQWDQYQLEVAEFWQLLALRAQDLDIPSDLGQLAEEGNFQAWTALMSGAIRIKLIGAKVIQIIRSYLAPRLEDIDGTPDEHWEWIEQNLEVPDVVHLLAAILSLDDWMEKKSRYYLMKVFQVQESQPPLAGSQEKPALLRLKSGNGLRSATEFGKSKSPNTSGP